MVIRIQLNLCIRPRGCLPKYPVPAKPCMQYGYTPLMIAAKDDKHEAAKVLINYKANIRAVDDVRGGKMWL